MAKRKKLKETAMSDMAEHKQRKQSLRAQHLKESLMTGTRYVNSMEQLGQTRQKLVKDQRSVIDSANVHVSLQRKLKALEDRHEDITNHHKYVPFY